MLTIDIHTHIIPDNLPDLTKKFGYEGFGELWPIRLLGFATGMISFPIITWLMIGEGITIKTGISIILAIVIMLLQLI